VSEQTLNTWKTEHPDFLESIKEGKALIDTMVEKSLLGRAMGCTIKEVKTFCSEGVIISETVDKHIQPDVAAQIFWLKNRKPKVWRDKHDVDFNAPFQITINEKDAGTL
jgi:hypothetical protein